MEKYRPLYINGEWVEPKSGEKIDVIDPSTEEIIAQAAKGGVEDVNAAVAAAQKAYDDFWRDTLPKERSNMLIKIAERMEEHYDEIARLESIDGGKPISVVKNDDLPFIIDAFRFFATAARHLEGKAAGEYEKDLMSIIRREPLGVCAGICPWNYPIEMVAWKAGAAMAAGNTIVMKPASLTPLSTLYFAEITKDIIPAGVFNVITGPGAEIGEALCKHPDVKLVSMTGDTKTGKRIAEVCSGTLKRVQLELGGKAPFIIFNDADLDNAVKAIKHAGFTNAGQDCGASCRILAQEGVYEDVVDRLIKAAESVKMGATDDPNMDVGPMISAKQRETVQGFVDRAVKDGATIRTGGKKVEGKGFYFEPTIITDADQKSEVIQEEVFGPVVTVQPFKDEAQAVEMANDVVYGLGSSVWTSDAQTLLRVSRNLQYGTVWANTYFIGTPEMPWGGYKQSGYGKDMSMYALEEYTQIKHVMTSLNF